MKNAVIYAALLVGIFALSLYVRLAGFHYPYLRNIDSYVFYRYMNYVVQHGHMPAVDRLMLAPTGFRLSPHGYLYVYLGAYSYEIFSHIMRIALWKFLIYFPAVLASLMVFPAYYIGTKLYDRNAGLISAFLLMFVPTIMARTLGGDPDSDSIVLLMSLITMAFFIATIKEKKWKIPISISAGIVLYLFSETWVGYWYIYWVLVGYTVAAVAYGLLRKVEWKWPVINLGLITLVFLLSNLAVYGLSGFSYFTSAFTSPIGTIGLFGKGGLKSEAGRQFPNVYVSVAEMQSSSIKQIVLSAGSNVFVPALLGFLYLIYSFIRKGKHFDSLVVFGIWFTGFLYASIMAVRFSIFLVIPVVFLASVALSKTWRLTQGEELEE